MLRILFAFPAEADCMIRQSMLLINMVAFGLCACDVKLPETAPSGGKTVVELFSSTRRVGQLTMVWE